MNISIKVSGIVKNKLIEAILFFCSFTFSIEANHFYFLPQITSISKAIFISLLILGQITFVR